MTTLLLIRHGESIANHERFFAGHFDADLHENGLLQAKETAKFIAENYKVDKIYASDLKRAFKTAKALADLLDMDIIPDKNLREINAGKWDGRKFEDLLEEYKESYILWRTHIGFAACDGGESVRQLADRAMAVFTKIAEENDGKTVAVATHATPIRAMQSLLQTGTLEQMENIPWPTNASVTVLRYDRGKWQLVAASLDDHLEGIKTGVYTKI